MVNIGLILIIRPFACSTSCLPLLPRHWCERVYSSMYLSARPFISLSYCLPVGLFCWMPLIQHCTHMLYVCRCSARNLIHKTFVDILLNDQLFYCFILLFDIGMCTNFVSAFITLQFHLKWLNDSSLSFFLSLRNENTSYNSFLSLSFPQLPLSACCRYVRLSVCLYSFILFDVVLYLFIWQFQSNVHCSFRSREQCCNTEMLLRNFKLKKTKSHSLQSKRSA